VEPHRARRLEDLLRIGRIDAGNLGPTPTLDPIAALAAPAPDHARVPRVTRRVPSKFVSTWSTSV